MNHILLVTDNPDRWPFDIPSATVVTARQYLTDPQVQHLRNCRIFNICRHYRYQSAGYYVSLLAEARGHRPIPKITTLQDLKTSSIYRNTSAASTPSSRNPSPPSSPTPSPSPSIFTQNPAKRYQRLAHELFNLFPAKGVSPIL